MDSKKQLAIAIVNFLKAEVESQRLGDDGTEGLEVAIQCLEQAYGTEDVSAQSELNLLDIYEQSATQQSTRPKTISEEDKKKAEDLKTKGNNYMKAEQFDIAIDCYTSAIGCDSRNAVYYCNRAAAYTKINDNTRAIADCEKALEIDPTYSKAYGRMGLVYMNEKNYEKAVQCYEKAVSMEPDNNLYQNNLQSAKEHMLSSKPAGAGTAAAANPLAGMDLNALLSNPAVMNMAQSFMQNPQMQSMFANMMGGQPPAEQQNQSNPTSQAGAASAEATEQSTHQGTSAAGGFSGGMDFGSIMNATHQFADQMQQQNPDLVENLRAQFQQGQHPPTDGEKKDQD